LILSAPTLADTVHHGKVVKIADGDTLTLLVDSKLLKIRLSDIDTPERKQPFGSRTKQARIVEVTVDRYGRIEERVYVGEVDVNR
jgi:micrococcal nuclease